MIENRKSFLGSPTARIRKVTDRINHTAKTVLRRDMGASRVNGSIGSARTPVFIGHYGVGFAAKRAAPQVSLGWLMTAPLLLDLLWPIFLLAGWEQVRIEPGNTAFTP